MVVDEEERYLQNQTMTPKRSWLTDFLASFLIVAELRIRGQSSPVLDGQGSMWGDSCHTRDGQEIVSRHGTQAWDKIRFGGHFSCDYWTGLYWVDCSPAIGGLYWADCSYVVGGQDCIMLTAVLHLVECIEWTLYWLTGLYWVEFCFAIGRQDCSEFIFFIFFCIKLTAVLWLVDKTASSWRFSCDW